MHCPFCHAQDTKVIDSRLVAGGAQVRRRRECESCAERYTTYEVAELVMPKVIKSDNERVPFDEDKLRRGLQKALEKRPVSVEQIEESMQVLMHKIRSTGEREVSSQFIGEQVMSILRDLDQVAFVRFASVYRSFEDVNAFREEITRLEERGRKSNG